VADEISLLFSDAKELAPKVDKLNELVDGVEAEDPWVKQQFGVSGSGEGLVWYPVGLDDDKGCLPMDLFASLVFKTKGLRHSVVGSKRSVQVAPEVVDSAEAFVEMFVTEGRLNQGWEEICGGGKVEIAKIGDFVNWICKDVEKESVAELRESNLSWPQVSGLVVLKSRKWFINQLNGMGGVDVYDEGEGKEPAHTETEKRS